MRVVVIGGNGLIGARVVGLLRRGGHDVRSASRASGVDALSGQGLASALAGADTVVDVADTRETGGVAPLAFFRMLSRNLAEAEAAAGVRHHVGLSIVGVDRLSGSYFAGKLAQEEAVRSSSVPHTIVRSTQFFELVERVLQRAPGRLIRLPPALVQPVASCDVAETLAEIATGCPLDATIEFAGTEQLALSELARLMLSADEDPRRVVPDTNSTFFGSMLDYRALIPGPDARLARATFADWLRERITPD